MKQPISLLIALLTLALTAAAQQTVGSWRAVSSYDTPTQLLDTPARLYYTSCGQLYSYDKDSGETYAFTPSGRLGGTDITRLYNDHRGSRIAIVYADAGIDIIEPDGTISHLSDIRDAELSVIPTVNDITFRSDTMLVATNFGTVAYDLARRHVITAGNYNINMTAIATQGNDLWLINLFNWYTAPLDGRLNSFTRFTRAWGYTTDAIVPLNDTQHVIIADGNRQLCLITLNPAVDATTSVTLTTTDALRDLQAIPGGGAIARDNNTLYLVSPDGTLTTRTIPATMQEGTVTTSSGLGAVWHAGPDGIALYNFTAATPELQKEIPTPIDAIGLSEAGRLHTAPDGTIYIHPYGHTQYHPVLTFDYQEPHPVYAITPDDDIIDVSPIDYTIVNQNNHSEPGKRHRFLDGSTLKAWPGHPGHYALGGTWDGLYIFDHEGREIVHYHQDNSTMMAVAGGYCLRALAFDFDTRGNLWVAQFTTAAGEPHIHFLPAAKVGKPTTPADWQQLPAPYTTGVESNLLASRHHPWVYYSDSSWEQPLTAINTRGTDTLTDDEVHNITSFIDQDGKEFSYYNIFSLLEDRDGHLWVGTNNGIFEITSPANIQGATARINHLKVPRRDGTNFADYLLDGQTILDMCLDPTGNKWIATENSGLYLVSAAGDRILEQFTTENSPLPTNAILSVTCGHDNRVYAGTRQGLLVYNSLASPAADDYSGIHAYPNPVRPDFSGWITIAGLMENSLVKITDAAGHVINQGKSAGGTYTWDGCDAQGRRVPTGVYYAIASASGEASGAATTKILVVN